VLVALLVAAAPVAGAVSAVYHGSREYRTIALTFDDGYYPASVRSILDTLRRYGVKATFFPTSQAVRSYPTVWRRVAAAGYPIGNHTINHRDLTTLGYSSVVYQITASRSAIRTVTGYPQIPFLRPPYGAWNDTVIRAAANSGYRKVVLWDVDSQDWRRPPTSTLVYHATRGRNGSIVLMHTLPGTATALPAIIRHYKERGFRFVTIPQLFAA
jgi:peptidoglycan/xylan/chitin deacetylase (PgdA/CDA1 family)